MEKHKIINSHNSWSQLEEVWLGGVYPASWYDHYDPEVRDVFHQLTEITQEDLTIIQKTLESLGVTVRRPKYNDINEYIDTDGLLLKPQICPRDDHLVVGNTLLYYHSGIFALPWQHAIDEYKTNPDNSCIAAANHILNGANVVRAGKDIIIDVDINDTKPEELPRCFDNLRIHWEYNGGHMDGCFAVLKPGLILANNYFDGYDRTFPGWDRIFLSEPTYRNKLPPGGVASNGKFFIPGVSLNRAFNEHVIKHAQDWVGDYTETYFELNCLVINESNVMMLGYNEALEKTLNSYGITVHWVPFRCRGFWDGGMHCITLDIRRQSSVQDYFPERG